MRLVKLESIYNAKRKLECAKNTLVVIGNDFNNPSGSLPDDIITSAIECVVNSLDELSNEVEQYLVEDGV